MIEAFLLQVHLLGLFVFYEFEAEVNSCFSCLVLDFCLDHTVDVMIDTADQLTHSLLNEKKSAAACSL